eukprot:TRINITY_DN924_c0_g1_i1.p1 TRINITY_DN924_c0_g1~~TRINITY_DN924_c0_g1_i1.p1  ORF type:complete len:452 (-),score=91.84 TRINITY_DN924_c0_g1_i1:199-1554(-)
MNQNHFPENVGIVGLSVYFPKRSVRQEDLESYMHVTKGKHTVGLGQQAMSFVGDREDIVSISMSCVYNILEKYQIDPKDIGRLEVGTETIIDKSKSVKTYLMQLFQASGNFDVEGVDNKNACYGGTNAFFNAVNWIESSSWDGRLALVVAADIAVYEKGPARPTGGCGAIAILVGPNAPLVLERGLRGSYFDHVFDFYKPNLTSEYPVVDGGFSIECYLRALDNCYQIYREKYEKVTGEKFTLDNMDHIIFHSPYNKLVQKALARIYYNDFKADEKNEKYSTLQKFIHLDQKSSILDRELQYELVNITRQIYIDKVEPSTLLSKELGNLYCGSLWGGLVSLFSTESNLEGKRISLFSYGSGLASSMFSFKVLEGYETLINDVNLTLSRRIFVDPIEFEVSLALRESKVMSKNYMPEEALDTLFYGSFYLERVDEYGRRYYNHLPSLEKPKL